MHRTLQVLAAGLLAISTASTARGVALGLEGSVVLHIGTITSAPIHTEPGAIAIVNGSGAAGHLFSLSLPSRNFDATGVVTPVTDPGSYPIAGIQLTARNGKGSLAGIGGGGFGGPMPLLGVMKVCLFAPCSSAIQDLSVPISVIGRGGNAFGTGAVNITVVGAPWTTRTAAVGSVTMMGGVSPLSDTGAPSGHLTLVTPVFISTNVSGYPAYSIVPTFATMSLHFVPEPMTLTLLGLGIAGLAAYGHTRGRD